MVEMKEKQIPWTKKLIFELWLLQPRISPDGSRRGNPGAFAQLRNSIRGNEFELAAYPYIIPSLPTGRGGGPLYVNEALILSQIYCFFSPERGPAKSDEQSAENDRYGQSIGTKLHMLSTENDTHDEDSPDSQKSTSSTERLLKTLITTDMDFLGRRLRGAVQMITKSNHPMTYRDYEKLAHDIAFWTKEDRSVQKRWVSDYYRG